jgi:hypothetical protein
MYVYGHEMLLLLQRRKKTLGFLSSKHTHTPQTACLQSLMHRKSRGRTQEKEQQTNKQTNNNKENLLFCLVHSTTLLHRT